MSVVVLCAFSAIAQERMPWQLSIAERLALRAEAARIPSQPRVQSTQRDEKPAPRFVIDGRETPELFLRTELMAILLSEFGDQTDRARVLDSYRSMQLAKSVECGDGQSPLSFGLCYRLEDSMKRSGKCSECGGSDIRMTVVPAVRESKRFVQLGT